MSAKDLLDKIQVKTPCEADWDSMVGNDQVRFCEHCNLTVQDLSQMSRKRALHLVTRSNGRLCVRYQRGPDGSVITRSVPQELFRTSRSASRIAAGAFSATLSLSSAVVQASPYEQSNASRYTIAAFTADAHAHGQSSLSATITGTITDANGAVIQGAGITLGNAQTRFLSGTQSNAEGEYRFEGLQPGTYSLRFEAPGFAPSEVGEVVLGQNANNRVDQRLEVATIQETVEVSSGDSEMVNVTSGLVAMPLPSDPLVKAALQDDLTEVQALLSHSNVNLRDKETGTSALEYAVRNGNREMVQALLHAGADVNSRNESKETVLMMLGEEGTSDIVWDLINAGAKVDLKDGDGDTALIEAAMANNIGVLTALLHAGAKVDSRNEAGQTALMMAAADGWTKNVRALIGGGADMNARDNDGKTPLTYAKENEREKVVKLLQSYGAIEGDVKKDKEVRDR